MATPVKSSRVPRVRMTAAERREQLIEVARGLFAERGFEGSAIEEVANRAAVSKPVVYEHFGGKDGLYTAVGGPPGGPRGARLGEGVCGGLCSRAPN